MERQVEKYINSFSEEDFKEHFGEDMNQEFFLDFFNVLDADEQEKIMEKVCDN